MNRDEAKQLLPIIQAFAEGKETQFYSEVSEQWEPVHNVDFSYPPKRYRIKPHTEKVTYRFGLYRSTIDKTVHIIAAHHAADVREIESWPYFIRWINPDFITEEMEI